MLRPTSQAQPTNFPLKGVTPLLLKPLQEKKQDLSVNLLEIVGKFINRLIGLFNL